MAKPRTRSQFKDYYLENKYSKWYFSIIQKAISRGWTKKTAPVYVENHHILPKSILKNNDVVCLTSKEHFICHLLLPKMMRNDKDKNKMIYALWNLSHHMKNLRKIKINSLTYANLKIHFSKLMSEKNSNEKNPTYGLKGEKHPAFGYKHTEKHKTYMSELFKGKNNPMYGKKMAEHIINKKSKKYIFLCDNKKIEVFNLRKFCRDNNLDQGAMTRVNNGKQIKHKGYSKYA